MRARGLASCILAFAITTTCYASGFSLFQDAAFKSSQGTFTAALFFGKQLGYADRPLSFFKNFIHVEFPDTKIRGAARSFAIKDDPFIKEILLVQYTPSTMRMRIVLNQNAERFFNNFKVTVESNKAQVTFIQPQNMEDPQAAAAPMVLPTMAGVETTEVYTQGAQAPGEGTTTTQADMAAAPQTDTAGESPSETTGISVPVVPVADVAQPDRLPTSASATTTATVTKGKDFDAEEFITEGKKTEGTAKQEDTQESSALPFGRLFIAFFAVLAALVGCALAYKKVSTKLAFGGRADGMNIKLVATQIIAPKKSLAVVNIGGRNFLIGVADDSINLISEVDQRGEQLHLDTAPARTLPEENSKLSFADQLKRNMFAQQQTAAPAERTYSGKDRLREMAKMSDLIRDKVSMAGLDK